MGDLVALGGFFDMSKPERDHAEKTLSDELAVIKAAIIVVERRRENALTELRCVDREMATLTGRRESIERLLKVSLTQQGGTA